MPTIQRFCVHLLEMWPTKHLAQVLAENSFSVTVFMDGPEEAGQREGRKNSMHRVPWAWYAEGAGKTCKEYYIRVRDEVVFIEKTSQRDELWRLSSQNVQGKCFHEEKDSIFKGPGLEEESRSLKPREVWVKRIWLSPRLWNRELWDRRGWQAWDWAGSCSSCLEYGYNSGGCRQGEHDCICILETWWQCLWGVAQRVVGGTSPELWQCFLP